MRSTSAALISLLTSDWPPCRWDCKLSAAPKGEPSLGVLVVYLVPSYIA